MPSCWVAAVKAGMAFAAVLAAPGAMLAPACTPPLRMLPIADVSTAAVTRVAMAQARNPWAVSRKYTSSVWVPIQRVRKRPARYPPVPAETSWVTVTHTIVAVPKTVAVAPWPDHGETEESPRPTPRISKIRDSAAAPAAPAKMAAHDTALAGPADLGGNGEATPWATFFVSSSVFSFTLCLQKMRLHSATRRYRLLSVSCLEYRRT